MADEPEEARAKERLEDYLDLNMLQHEILQTLREIGVTYTKTGTDAGGHRAIFYYSPGSGLLQFGLLVGLLNGYKYDDPTRRNPVFLNTARINFEDVVIGKYRWEDVSKAVEILAFNKHVDDEIQRRGNEIEDRLVRLLPAGLLAYNTAHYLKEKEKEEIETLLLKSNLTTEKAVRETATATKQLYFATLAIAAVTLIVGLIPLFKDDGRDSTQQSQAPIQQRQQPIQTQQLPPTNVPFPAKAAKDSISPSSGH